MAHGRSRGWWVENDNSDTKSYSDQTRRGVRRMAEMHVLEITT